MEIRYGQFLWVAGPSYLRGVAGVVRRRWGAFGVCICRGFWSRGRRGDTARWGHWSLRCRPCSRFRWWSSQVALCALFHLTWLIPLREDLAILALAHIERDEAALSVNVGW